MEIILAAILAGGLLVKGVATPQRAEKATRKALEKQFPGAKIAVDIEGKRGTDVLNGRFKSITIDISKANIQQLPISWEAPRDNLPYGATTTSNTNPTGMAGQINILLHDFVWHGLPIDAAELRFQQVQYDFDALQNRSELRLQRIGTGTMHLKVDAVALTPIFAARVEGADNMVPHFMGGELHLDGEKKILGVAAPFEVAGRLVPADSQVQLQDGKLLLSGMPLPDKMAAPVLKDARVLFDFDKEFGLPLKVSIAQLTADNDSLDITANLTPKS